MALYCIQKHIPTAPSRRKRLSRKDSVSSQAHQEKQNRSMASSAYCGQAALIPLPNSRQRNNSKERTLEHYELAAALKVLDQKKLKALTAGSGVDVLKVSSNGKLQSRKVAFSPDKRSLLVTSNKIKSIKGLFGREASATIVDISMLDSVLDGQLTRKFRIANADPENDMLAQKAKKSLSIIYRPSSNASIIDGLMPAHKDVDPASRLETMDLVVLDPADHKLLLKTLKDLITIYRKEKANYDPELLFIQYHWFDAGKELSDPMTMGEWVAMCKKMNVPLKKSKLQNIFRDACEELDVENDALSISVVAELMGDVKFFSMQESGLKFVNEDPMLRLWYDMLATDPVQEQDMDDSMGVERPELETKQSGEEKSISSVAFLSFLRSEQKAYKTALDQATEKIRVINDQLSIQDLVKEGGPKPRDFSDRLTKSRFLSFLYSDTNDLMDPAKGRIGYDDMNQPLSHYWINTSHDTYLRYSKSKSGDLEAKPDEQMYLAALNRGVRCIELDIWGSSEGEPVICSEAPKSDGSDSLPLSIVLKIVREFLLANPKSFPLILNIENHCSFAVQEKAADLLFQILGVEGLILVPDNSESVDEADLLPSPASMMGKVLIIGKKPKVVEKGAIVVNDDYDAENDGMIDEILPSSGKLIDEDDEVENGIVIGFTAAGPIRSSDPAMQISHVRHTPAELHYLAQQDEDKAKMEAAEAEVNASTAIEVAERAERVANLIIEQAGLRKEDVEKLSFEVRGTDLDPKEHARLLNGGDEEGLEVQDFFGGAVDGAKAQHSEAERKAYLAAEAATQALQKLNSANEDVRKMESQVEKEIKHRKMNAVDQQKASSDARSKREHADIAKERVKTVKELLDNCEQNAASAENVVMTAMTEAKISEKRAVEIEKRAEKAMETAKKDRRLADEDTKYEEELEQRASSLHEQCRKAAEAEKDARNALEKAMASLEKVSEQIKLIENSTQFQQEKKSFGHTHEYKDTDSANSGQGSSLAKHAAKVEERVTCSNLVKEASLQVTKSEADRRKLQVEFEETAHKWKHQADVAARARKQADRSMHTAEALAEHADEEREAANLRQTARDKAKTNVTEKDAYKQSLEAQLIEAERAAEEAERLALEARQKAENIAKVEAPKLSQREENLVKSLEEAKNHRDAVREEYKVTKLAKVKADNKVKETKRLYETSSEVLASAIRDSENQRSSENSKTSATQRAVAAFNTARLARKEADHAIEVSKMAVSNAIEKEGAAAQALDYKNKHARVTQIPVALAKMTFLHKARFRYWERSFDQPNTHMHSFSQGGVEDMVERDYHHGKNLRSFAIEHMCRSFPSASGESLSYDPIFQWANGIQLCAMNCNVFDRNMAKVDGRFRRNGSSGYVLKPAYLTDSMEKRVERAQKWKINVLCGKSMPHVKGLSSGGGLLVKMLAFEGTPQGPGYVAEHKTKVVKKNGFNPVWDDKEGFSFSCASPALSIVVISVVSQADSGSQSVIAFSAIPVSCLREGYRSVALFDRSHSRPGPFAFSALLVRAQKVSI